MSIHSEAENSAAHVLAQGSLPLWIGMSKVSKPHFEQRYTFLGAVLTS